MRVRLWGTRGSVARAGSGTVRYGGDTPCVEVTSRGGSVVILDAGSGLPLLSRRMAGAERIDLLLTHLHMDHVQGIGFFQPFRDPEIDTHVWGPVSTFNTLEERLLRYMSPPLFPVRIRDFKNVTFHDMRPGVYRIGDLTVIADMIIHPGPTLGFRLAEDGGGTIAYLPDHEPALGARRFHPNPRWTSGFDLMQGCDVVIHDAQYTEAEYQSRVGWGHSTLAHAIKLAEAAGVGKLVPFHHDPDHTDDDLDAAFATAEVPAGLALLPGRAGLELDL